MITIEVPLPSPRFNRLLYPDGSQLTALSGSAARITFERVVPKNYSLPDVPFGTPECIRIVHRLCDLSGEEYQFTSHVPAEFLWEQLYVNETYTDWRHMLEERSHCMVLPWRETVVIESIHDYNDLRNFRAFRVRHRETPGHPDVVPVFDKHLSWTARLTHVTARWDPSISNSVAHYFAASFVETCEFTALRLQDRSDAEEVWKEIALCAPFHVLIPMGDLLWRSFVEPDDDGECFRTAASAVCVSSTKPRA